MEDGVLMSLWVGIIRVALEPLLLLDEHFPELFYQPIVIVVLVFFMTMRGLLRKNKSCWVA